MNERGSIVVRAHASHVEGLRFESDSMPLLNARSLFTQQQMGTQWQYWGEKGGEERNWPSYLTCQWLRISVLSNRHSALYESIQDYLYFSYLQVEIACQLMRKCLTLSQLVSVLKDSCYMVLYLLTVDFLSDTAMK